MVRKEKDDFLAVHELAAANCLIKVEQVKKRFNRAGQDAKIITQDENVIDTFMGKVQYLKRELFNFL